MLNAMILRKLGTGLSCLCVSGLLAIGAPADGQGKRTIKRPLHREGGMPNATDPTPRRDLPFAMGKEFRCLDDYLAYLEPMGAYDTPYWRLTKRGHYELISRRGPGQAPVTATRAELMKRYGFAC
jgi:hypothetical protein